MKIGYPSVIRTFKFLSPGKGTVISALEKEKQEEKLSLDVEIAQKSLKERSEGFSSLVLTFPLQKENRFAQKDQKEVQREKKKRREEETIFRTYEMRQ